MTSKTAAEISETVGAFQADVNALRTEVARAVVGQTEVVDASILCMLAGSHALLEGVPGLGKTLLVRTLAQALDLRFSRIQFTPDLMPADIVGTTILAEGESGRTKLEFREGPIFANLVLADEVNRATPKTQSALLEAMQEHRVTVLRTTHTLEEPFFVLATQNPLESEGTYPLPEAQLDRFFFKIHVPFPKADELTAILDRTTGSEPAAVKPVLARKRLIEMQRTVRDVPVPASVRDYVVRLLQATHPDGVGASTRIKKYVRFGASPRGAQALLLAAKIRALFDGRFAPGMEDVRRDALAALRHRVLLNFEGEADGVRTDDLIRELLETLPEAK